MAASVKTARCPLLKRNKRPRKGANFSAAVPRLSPAAHQGTSPVVDDVSRGFVQRLAANEPRTRRRALASLRKFLRVKSAAEALPSSQQLFLWKGLFYALWQQDKPLLQEELIVSICSLLHELQTETTQLEFTEACWLTVKREWNGIDHFRLDKFYLLVRTFLAQTFVLLRRTGWDKRLITRFLSPLSLIVLGMERGEGKSSFKCKKEQGPSAIEEAAKYREGLRAVKEYSNGLRFHVAEIFMKELNQAARNLPEDAVLLFLKPFVHVLATTEEDLWMDVVCQTVFKDLLKGRASKSKQRGNTKRSKNVQVKENEEIADDSFDEDVDYEGHQLQVSYSEVSQLLLHSAAQPEVRQKNRRRMYKIAQRLRSVTVGFAVQKNESYIGELLCRRKEDQMVRKRKRKEEEIAELKGKNKKRRKRTKQKKKAIERLNKVVGVVETEGQLKEVKTGEAERDELRKKWMGGDGEEAEEEEEEAEEAEEEEEEEEEEAEAEEEEEEHEEAEAEEEHEAESEEEEEHEAESEEEEEHEAESEEEEEEEAEAEEEEDHEAAAAGEAEEAKVEGSVLLEVGRVKRAWKSQEGSISANLKQCNSEKRVKFRLKKNQTTEYSPFIPLNLKKRTLVPFDPNTPTPRGVLKVGRHRT